MTTPKLPATSKCYATTLRKASRRLTQLYDKTLAPAGLRSTQYAILAELVSGCDETPTLNELADAMVLDRSGLGHSLRPLERDGLIRLETNSRDRRSTLVVVTEQGRKRYKLASALWQQAQDRYTAVVGQAEGEHLRLRLLAIAHNDTLTEELTA